MHADDEKNAGDGRARRRQEIAWHAQFDQLTNQSTTMNRPLDQPTDLEGEEVRVHEVLLRDVGAEVVARVRLPSLGRVLHAVGGEVWGSEACSFAHMCVRVWLRCACMHVVVSSAKKGVSLPDASSLIKSPLTGRVSTTV